MENPALHTEATDFEEVPAKCHSERIRWVKCSLEQKTLKDYKCLEARISEPNVRIQAGVWGIALTLKIGEKPELAILNVKKDHTCGMDLWPITVESTYFLKDEWALPKLEFTLDPERRDFTNLPKIAHIGFISKFMSAEQHESILNTPGCDGEYLEAMGWETPLLLFEIQAQYYLRECDGKIKRPKKRPYPMRREEPKKISSLKDLDNMPNAPTRKVQTDSEFDTDASRARTTFNENEKKQFLKRDERLFFNLIDGLPASKSFVMALIIKGRKNQQRIPHSSTRLVTPVHLAASPFPPAQHVDLMSSSSDQDSPKQDAMFENTLDYMNDDTEKQNRMSLRDLKDGVQVIDYCGSKKTNERHMNLEREFEELVEDLDNFVEEEFFDEYFVPSGFSSTNEDMDENRMFEISDTPQIVPEIWYPEENRFLKEIAQDRDVAHECGIAAERRMDAEHWMRQSQITSGLF